MYTNSSPTPQYVAAVQMIEKYIRQYFASGELQDRFQAFDKTAEPYGAGFDISVILAATKQTSKQAEHGSYPPNGFALRFATKTGGQYAVTLDPAKVNACVDSEAAAQEYAAMLTESLYQGWTRDKANAVATECGKIIAQSAKSGTKITLGADVEAWALSMLTQIKAQVMNLREGIKGSDYGNKIVGSNEIAANDIVIVMSHNTAATLDAYGYAKVFTPDYVDVNNVTRITSNKIEDNTVLIIDAKNIQVRKKYEAFVGPLQNSDGSQNFFYNREEYIEAAVAQTSNEVAFPFYVIKTQEE